MRRLIVIGFAGCAYLVLPCPGHGQPPGSGELAKGISSYERQRWTESMGHFVQALSEDPSNPEAHAYLDLLVQKIQSQQVEYVRETRLAMLADISKRLESNHMDSWVIDKVMAENAKDESQHKEEQWHAKCIMAQMENRMGHLAAANDLVLQVIGQDPNNAEAQRMLSDFQSQIRERLDAGGSLREPERAALEGFYAYGQADYRLAHRAWDRARAAIGQTSPPEEAGAEIAALHFETYDKVAQRHVEEEDRRKRDQTLFAEGTDLFQKGAFAQGLDHFRQVALSNPDYPQLALYLVQSEAAVEKDRTRRLSEEKRNKAAEAFAVGVSALEKGQYPQAKRAFEDVLAQDPSHPQAKSYLSVVETEMNRRRDPRAAKQHFEAGVISFAAGKIEEAIREWSIATRLDPDNVRAANALSKARKVLQESRDVPG